MTAKNQVAVGTFGNPYLYAGYYYDVETGMYYLNARYYSPRTGRFISRDAMPQMATERLALNAYAYTENNPVNKVDPSGYLTKGAALLLCGYDWEYSDDSERWIEIYNIDYNSDSNARVEAHYDRRSDDPGMAAWADYGNGDGPYASSDEGARLRAEADRQWYQDHSLGSLADNPALLSEMHSESEVSDIAYNMLTGNTGINMQNGLRLTGSAAVAMGVGVPGSKYEYGGTWQPTIVYTAGMKGTGWDVGALAAGHGEEVFTVFEDDKQEEYRSIGSGFSLSVPFEGHWDNKGGVINPSGLEGPGFSWSANLIFFRVEVGISQNPTTGVVSSAYGIAGWGLGLGVAAYATNTARIDQ